MLHSALWSQQPHATLQLEEEWLERCPLEKDLGCWFLVAEHDPAYAQVDKKASGTPACISNSVARRSRAVTLPLYSSLLRSYLEYCVQLWAYQYKKDLEMLGCVQRRATELAKGWKHKSSNEELKELEGWGKTLWLTTAGNCWNLGNRAAAPSSFLNCQIASWVSYVSTGFLPFLVLWAKHIQLCHISGGSWNYKTSSLQQGSQSGLLYTPLLTLKISFSFLTDYCLGTHILYLVLQIRLKPTIIVSKYFLNVCLCKKKSILIYLLEVISRNHCPRSW